MKKLNLGSKLRRRKILLKQRLKNISLNKVKQNRIKKVILVALALTFVGGAIWYHPKSKSLMVKLFKKASKLKTLNGIEHLSNSKESKISTLNKNQPSYIRFLFNTVLMSLILAMIHNINADISNSSIISSDSDTDDTNTLMDIIIGLIVGTVESVTNREYPNLRHILTYGKNHTVTKADPEVLPTLIAVFGFLIPGLAKILSTEDL